MSGESAILKCFGKEGLVIDTNEMYLSFMISSGVYCDHFLKNKNQQ